MVIPADMKDYAASVIKKNTQHLVFSAIMNENTHKIVHFYIYF